MIYLKYVKTFNIAERLPDAALTPYLAYILSSSAFKNHFCTCSNAHIRYKLDISN
ncbi:hypothetical protein ESCAB7627_0663 [Escherichia albertii TW07627]|uniref:Uncharacterized protein n=1 Tax=Escherichia albertii (strain TW07627) TaxID=502347 RepID=A0ABC9NVA3_ESCAT|nr:hypothetical protein ESCAB7627_0663 [Escherichia albertii TW07627]